MGDSAGGNLALTTTLALRDREHLSAVFPPFAASSASCCHVPDRFAASSASCCHVPDRLESPVLLRPHLPLPAGVVALSPWADLECLGQSWRTNAAFDYLLHDPDLTASQWYAPPAPQGPGLRHPLVSPKHAHFRDFPPLLLQVGESETLLSDALDVQSSAERHGVSVVLEVYADMPHVFQFFPYAHHSKAAVAAIGKFVGATHACAAAAAKNKVA